MPWHSILMSSTCFAVIGIMSASTLRFSAALWIEPQSDERLNSASAVEEFKGRDSRRRRMRSRMRSEFDEGRSRRAVV